MEDITAILAKKERVVWKYINKNQIDINKNMNGVIPIIFILRNRSEELSEGFVRWLIIKSYKLDMEYIRNNPTIRNLLLYNIKRGKLISNERLTTIILLHKKGIDIGMNITYTKSKTTPFFRLVMKHYHRINKKNIKLLLEMVWTGHITVFHIRHFSCTIIHYLFGSKNLDDVTLNGFLRNASLSRTRDPFFLDKKDINGNTPVHFLLGYNLRCVNEYGWELLKRINNSKHHILSKRNDKKSTPLDVMYMNNKKIPYYISKDIKR